MLLEVHWEHLGKEAQDLSSIVGDRLDLGSGSHLLQSSPTLTPVLDRGFNSAQEFCPLGGTLSWLTPIYSMTQPSLHCVCILLGYYFICINQTSPVFLLPVYVHIGINKNSSFNWICHIKLTQVESPKSGRVQLLDGIDRWHSKLCSQVCSCNYPHHQGHSIRTCFAQPVPEPHWDH